MYTHRRTTIGSSSSSELPIDVVSSVITMTATICHCIVIAVFSGCELLNEVQVGGFSDSLLLLLLRAQRT